MTEPTVCVKALRPPFLTAAIRTGRSLPELAERFDVSPATLGDVTARVPHSLVVRVWDGLAELCDEQAFGLVAASTLGVPQVDVVDVVLQRSATLGALLSSFERYQRLFHEANDAYVREEGEDSVVAHRFRGNLARSKPFIEFVLAMWVLRLNALAGSERAGVRRVTFAHEAPPDPERYRKHFGVEVLWDATEDAVVLSRARLDAPLTAGDAESRAVFEAHLDRELAALPSESLLERVRAHVVTLIRQGSEDAFDVDHIARRLALSRRTLQRRLAEHDTSFRDQIDLARREIALAELKRGVCSVTDLAFLLGFSENSAFSRAFRRWTGRTPAHYARRG